MIGGPKVGGETIYQKPREEKTGEFIRGVIKWWKTGGKTSGEITNSINAD